MVKQQQLAANLAQTKHLSELLLLMEVYLPASRLRALILHSLLAASHAASLTVTPACRVSRAFGSESEEDIVDPLLLSPPPKIIKEPFSVLS